MESRKEWMLGELWVWQIEGVKEGFDVGPAEGLWLGFDQGWDGLSVGRVEGVSGCGNLTVEVRVDRR